VTTTGPTLPERIGRYRVVARIGKGAMGSVYSAVDEQLGRHVAVKLMLAEFEEDPELRERFFREARITGQLAHRNIVTVFDLGEEAGRPYIVMELLEGLPLNEYLRKDPPVPLDTKLDLMIQICDGLQNAHQAGVVHRDLKPSNLFVVRDGTVKVLDFGVARLAASNLTAAGMLREHAYKVVQGHAMHSWDTGGDFRAAILSDREIGKYLKKEDVERAFGLERQLANVAKIYERVFGS